VAHLTAPRWRDAAQAEGQVINLRLEVSGPAVIEGHRASLREALTNLIFNAVDAMPPGGTITLRAECRDDQVVVSVSDTGSGIPPAIRARIFEPFFTTKGDRGTGLGLAQVMAVVEQHRGRLELETAPGQGTTFRLWFPPASPSHVAAAPETASASRAATTPLRILAVDDEERLARLAARLLAPEGHVVSVALSGEQALGLLDEAPFDLVITDLGLGAGMNGWELAESVRARHPDVRVILATGWGASITPEEAASHGVQAVVAKPYRARELRELVASVARTPAAVGAGHA
jgi:CheY-like chemotaxis protein/anti-sigma regulatory factor (Ser/Thr protein kinase)